MSVFYKMCNVFYITLKYSSLTTYLLAQKKNCIFSPRNNFRVYTGAAEIARGFQMRSSALRKAKYLVLNPFCLSRLWCFLLQYFVLCEGSGNQATGFQLLQHSPPRPPSCMQCVCEISIRLYGVTFLLIGMLFLLFTRKATISHMSTILTSCCAVCERHVPPLNVSQRSLAAESRLSLVSLPRHMGIHRRTACKQRS